VGKSIRILSGNLWWGKASPEGLVDLIRRHDVDVFAAQELGYETAEAIASELPFGCLEPTASFQGMGVALRRPGHYSQIPLHYRAARRVVLDPADWDGLARPLDLVNVHFQAPHALRPFPSPLVRRRQVRGLERFFEAHPSDARLIVGDYNATPAWPLYRRLSRSFADGAIQSAQREGRGVEPTWGPSSESRRLLRIDHAMVRGLVIENFRVIDLPGSDHSGLLFDCAPGPIG
jgi:endonuclease/exonuclease/phosphatase family metal-dependent hydrolase